jgi:hypothetical protein
MLKMATTSVAEKWEAFRPEIESALPPISIESPDRMNNILASILTEVLECYVVYSENEDMSKNLLAILTLTVIGQIDSEHKNLLIYTLTGTQQAMSPREWIEAVDILKSIAEAKGCKRIIAYSNNLNVIRFMEKLGVDTSYRVMTINV